MWLHSGYFLKVKPTRFLDGLWRHPWGIHSKTLSGCLKSRIVPNSAHAMLFFLYIIPMIKFNLKIKHIRY